ncbi:MAG: cupin domain-containing protein [Terracidiphilus sp.]|jgi:mannose-6-phosphate isomerase-like protein (cupin superfamily)
MDGFEKEIWKELLAPEREVTPPVANAKRHTGLPAGSDHWSAPVLMERAAYLRKLAKHGDGQASETLKEYPQHATMLSFRARDREAELHENFADLFYVLEGRATLVTGGTVVGANTVAPGEVRGAAIEGGKRQELRAGDVAHVPAGVPHQMLVPGDKTFTSFVVKIQQ